MENIRVRDLGKKKGRRLGILSKDRELSSPTRPLLSSQMFTYDLCIGLGLGTEFRSEKIPRNRLGTISVIPRKKAFIPRHSEFRGRANSEARNRTERNGMEFRGKFSFTKQQQNNLTKWFVCTSKVVYSGTIFEIFGCCVLFWVGFTPTEWFGTEFREFASIWFLPRNGILSCVLIRRRVRNRIMGVLITHTSIPSLPPASILSTRGL